MARSNIVVMPDPANLTPSQAPEGITQTFKAGSPLVYSAGGLIEATNANPMGANQKLVGISNTAGRNLAAAQAAIAGQLSPYQFDPLMYFACLPHYTFIGSLDLHGTLGRALAASDIGTTVGLNKETDGIWYLDTGSANKYVIVVGLVDPVGTASGRVMFKFLLTTDETIYA